MVHLEDSKQYTVKAFEEADLFTVIEFGKEFWNRTDFDEDACARYICDVYGHGIILMAFDGDKPIGTILAIESMNHFNGKKVMYRTDVFVVPDYRGKGVAKLLHTRLKEIGHTLGFEEYTWEMEKPLWQ